MRSTPTPSKPAATGSQTGWYVVGLANGDSGLVRWVDNAWDWSGTAPTAQVTSATFVGSTYQDLSDDPAKFTHALASLPTLAARGLIGEVDAGQTSHGKSAVLNAQGQPVSGTPKHLGSEANSAAVSAPSITNPISGVIGFLTDPTTWIRFAELIGGIALILMGLRSLTGSTTSPVTVATTAAKRAAEVTAA